jgi:hypothetical protein
VRHMRGPDTGTPARWPGSWRRTSSVDMSRPDGPSGHLVLECRGRDLYTASDGSPVVTDAVRFGLVVDYFGGTRIEAVDGDPPWLGRLRGRSATGGFRRMVTSELDPPPAEGSLAALLLDEIPVVTMISRAALSDRHMIVSGGSPLSIVDVCSGWRSDGGMASTLQRTGLLPPIERPSTPDLSTTDDPLAWHAMPDEFAAGSMRRIRRLDVVPGTPVRIDSLFRDSLQHPAQGHRVVHEYGVTAQVEPHEPYRITAITSSPHVLPAQECPAAAASARRLVARELATLRELVRQDFAGTSTCTHLNDHLRAVGDLATLLRATPA